MVAENSTREPHRLLASSIGVGIPADRNTYGYLSEHHASARGNGAPETTPRNWPPRCWPPRSTWSSIPTSRWDEKKEVYRTVEQDRPHDEHHAVGGGRQTRPVDHGDCGGDLPVRLTGKGGISTRFSQRQAPIRKLGACVPRFPRRPHRLLSRPLNNC